MMRQRPLRARGAALVALALCAFTIAEAGLLKPEVGVKGRVRSIAYDPEGAGMVLVATTAGLYAIADPWGADPHAHLLHKVEPRDILVLAPGGGRAARLRPWREGEYSVILLQIRGTDRPLTTALRIDEHLVSVRDLRLGYRGELVLTGLPEHPTDILGSRWSWRHWSKDGKLEKELTAEDRWPVVLGPAGRSVGYRTPQGLEVHVPGEEEPRTIPGPFRRAALSGDGIVALTDDLARPTSVNVSTAKGPKAPLASEPVFQVALSPSGTRAVVADRAGNVGSLTPDLERFRKPIPLVGGQAPTITSIVVDDDGRTTGAGVYGPPERNTRRRAWIASAKADGSTVRLAQVTLSKERAVPTILHVAENRVDRRPVVDVVIGELTDIHLVRLERP
jgi:hypothetical protein